jgi:pheromone shutdown-related protein TraB
MSNTLTLPERVSHITLDGKDIYLVGTAHLSRESVEDVRKTIEQVQPDTICVELCKARYTTITQKDIWEKMDIFKIIREKKAALLLAQLILTSFYRRLGQKLGIQPGAEMLEAIKLAEERNTQLVLADRDIGITLKRVWGYLGFWNKLKLMMNLTMAVFSKEPIDDATIEKLKEKDQLESVMVEFADKFPEIKKRLLDERDVYLSQKVRSATGKTIVAVVGAGHVKGISSHILKEESIEELTKVPRKSALSMIIAWGVPTIIVGLIIVAFFTRGVEHSLENIYIWVLVTGSLSAIGAAAALAHPLTILSAFLAAPITTLHPMIASGWVAGLVQAWIKKPTVADFEDLPDAVETIRGFWINPVIKILLIAAFSNLGSMLGVYISGIWIAARSV